MPATISYVDGHTINGNSLSSGQFTLPHGGGTVAVGDLAICAYFCRVYATTNSFTAPSGGGAPNFSIVDYNNSTYGRLWVGGYWVTQTMLDNGYIASWSAGGGTNYTNGEIVAVFRNVDTSTPLDGVTPQIYNGTVVQVWNPTAVTPTTTGAAVVVVAAALDDMGATWATSTNYTSDWPGSDNQTDVLYSSWSQTGGSDASCLFEWRLGRTGGVSEDPGNQLGSTQGTTTVTSYTFALKPSLTQKGTGNLVAVGDGTGTGTKFTLEQGTGEAISCAAATATGGRLRPRTGSGVATAVATATGSKTAAGAWSGNVVEDGLVAHYRAARADDGIDQHANADADRATWTDVAGSADGTLDSSFEYTTSCGWSTSTPYALVQDGTHGAVDCGDLAAWDTTEFTIEMWIDPAASQVSVAGVAGNYISPWNGGWCIIMNGTTGQLRFETYGSSGYSPGWQGDDYRGAGLLHIVGVASADRCLFAINGAVRDWGVGPYTHGLPDSGAHFVFGSRDLMGSNFSGKIHAVRFYNRALSGAELVRNYNAGPDGECPPLRDNLTSEYVANKAIETWAGRTFGHTSDSPDLDAGNANCRTASQFTMTEAGWVTKLTHRLNNQNTGHTTAHMKGLIYSNSPGGFHYPVSLLAVGTEVTITDNIGNTWIDFPFAEPVYLPAGTYWLGTHQASDTAGIQNCWQTGTGWQAYIFDTYSDGPGQNWGNTNSYNNELCIYATYTDDGDPNSNSDGTNRGTWDDIAGSYDGTLQTFSYTSASGWDGSGTAADPYRLVFDGSSDYIDMGDVFDFGAADRSFECWVTLANVSSYQRFFSKQSTSGAAPGWHLRLQTTGRLFAEICEDSASITRTGQGSTVLSTGTLYHLVFVYDAPVWSIYVNGIAETMTAGGLGGTPNGTNALAVQIGRSNTGAQYLNGSIPAWRVYDRALTAEEIARNYFAGVNASSFGKTRKGSGNAVAVVHATATGGKTGGSTKDGSGNAVSAAVATGSASKTASRTGTGVACVAATATGGRIRQGTSGVAGGIVTNGLASEYVGKLAKNGTSPGNNTDPTSTWDDLVGGRDLTALGTFDWNTSSGWRGNGSAGDPYCVQFDSPGTTRFEETSSSPIDGDSTYTIETWLYLVNGVPLSLFNAGDGNPNIIFEESGSTGYVHHIWWEDGTPNGDNTDFEAVGTVDIRSAWHHVVLRHDASRVLTVWVDGSQQGNTPTTHGIQTLNALAVGCQAYGTARDVGTDSRVATVRFYTRSLSTSEIDQNYDAGILATSLDATAGVAAVVHATATGSKASGKLGTGNAVSAVAATATGGRIRQGQSGGATGTVATVHATAVGTRIRQRTGATVAAVTTGNAVTVGYTSVFASQYSNLVGDLWMTSVTSPAWASKAAKISAYLHNQGAGHAACYVKLVVYGPKADPSVNTPLLAVSQPIYLADNAAAAWVEATVSCNLAANTEYLIGVIGDANATGATFYYESSGWGTHNNTASYASPPNPYGNETSPGTLAISVYLTTAAGPVALRVRPRTGTTVAAADATANATKSGGGKNGTGNLVAVAVATAAAGRTAQRTGTAVAAADATATGKRVRERTGTGVATAVATATGGRIRPRTGTAVAVAVGTGSGTRTRSRTGEAVACAVAAATGGRIRPRTGTGAGVAVATAAASKTASRGGDAVAAVHATAAGGKIGTKYGTGNAVGTAVATATAGRVSRRTGEGIAVATAVANGGALRKATGNAVAAAHGIAAGSKIGTKFGTGNAVAAAAVTAAASKLANRTATAVAAAVATAAATRTRSRGGEAVAVAVSAAAGKRIRLRDASSVAVAVAAAAAGARRQATGTAVAAAHATAAGAKIGTKYGTGNLVAVAHAAGGAGALRLRVGAGVAVAKAAAGGYRERLRTGATQAVAVAAAAGKRLRGGAGEAIAVVAATAEARRIRSAPASATAVVTMEGRPVYGAPANVTTHGVGTRWTLGPLESGWSVHGGVTARWRTGEE